MAVNERIAHTIVLNKMIPLPGQTEEKRNPNVDVKSDFWGDRLDSDDFPIEHRAVGTNGYWSVYLQFLPLEEAEIMKGYINEHNLLAAKMESNSENLEFLEAVYDASKKMPNKPKSVEGKVLSRFLFIRLAMLHLRS